MRFRFVIDWAAGNKLSTVLVGVTAVLTVYVFFGIFERIYGSDLDTNFLKWSNYEYKFYSSRFKGPYFAIGKILDSQVVDGNIKLINDTNSSGAYDNALQVNSNSGAFTIVQENLIKKGDILGEKIEYIAPIYMERMHVIYRKAAFPGIKPEISDNPNRELLKKMSQDIRINIGAVGSGTRMIATYILNEINKQIKSLPENVQQKKQPYHTSDLSLPQVINAMSNPPENDTIDIAFVISACPIKKIEKLLDSDERYGLMSISPSFVLQLNKTYNLGLRLTSFEKKYSKECNSISTFGIFAFLATNTSTPKTHILAVLKEISRLKDSINCKIYGARCDTTKTQALSEYNFYNHFQKKYDDTYQTTLKGVLGLLITFFSVFAIILKQLYWLMSLVNKWQYNIRLKHFAEKVKAMKEVEKESALEEIHKDIVGDYANSRLVEAHFNGLKEEIELLKKDLHPDQNDHRQKSAA